MRDYEEWHRAYDDPGSGLSWRLRQVQAYLGDGLDRYAGPVRILSSCSGDGRDVLGVLAARPDRDRVGTTLIELHPEIAERARRTASAWDVPGVEVRTADAGQSQAYLGAVPAHLVLMVGIFGNISDADLARTIRATPQFCAPGATLLWSRGRGRNGDDDRNHTVRLRFAEAGFPELDYATQDTGDRPALGAMRYDGPAQDLVTDRRLFTFLR